VSSNRRPRLEYEGGDATDPALVTGSFTSKQRWFPLGHKGLVRSDTSQLIHLTVENRSKRLPLVVNHTRGIKPLALNLRFDQDPLASVDLL
jgi:hypothetical protein